MTAYDLAEQIAEALAQRTDIDDMAPPVEQKGAQLVEFDVTISGELYRVSVEERK